MTPMMAMTTRSSTRVKPRLLGFVLLAVEAATAEMQLGNRVFFMGVPGNKRSYRTILLSARRVIWANRKLGKDGGFS